MTEAMTPLALVGTVIGIRPHPDPEVTRLEILSVAFGRSPDKSLQVIDLVTGKHYRDGQMGVWVRPGAWIPGWLAMELWLVGKKRSRSWFEVRSIEIKGVQSPGLFCGEVYMKDGSDASATRYGEAQAHGGAEQGGWISWPYWRPEWKLGDVLDDYLGVVPACPHSSVAEQPVANRQVAAKTTAASRPVVGQGVAAVEASGSTPAVGSTS